MEDRSQLFNMFILDSNVFINLAEAGLDKKIIPNLEKIITPAKVRIPEELPKTDIPTRFRDVRRIVREKVKGLPVDRKGKLWNWTAHLAKINHFIRYQDDPADIDVIVLARLLEKKDHKVAVVTDDQGIIQLIRKVGEFKSLGSLSAGAFFYMLAALAKDKDTQDLLEKAANQIYQQSLTYRRKTRKVIDIQSLVSELRDTSQFVRLAARQKQKSEEKEKIIISEPVHKPSKDDFKEILDGIEVFRAFRDNYNLFGAEEYYYKLQQAFSIALREMGNSDNYKISIQMIISELYEFHTWALEIRLKTQGITEALLHTEGLLTILNFFPTSNEIVEDVIAIQSMLTILTGRSTRALALAQQIPETNIMTSTQLMALVCGWISQRTEEGYEKGKELINEQIINKKDTNIDLLGFIDSLFNFANNVFTTGDLEFSVHLIELIIDIMADKDPEAIIKQAKRLFMLSLVSEPIMIESVKKKLHSLVKIPNNSNLKIPKRWKFENFTISGSDTKNFQGTIHIIIKNQSVENFNEFYVIAYEENTESVWRFVFDKDYAIPIQNAMSVKLKGGKISKLQKRTLTDSEYIRGTVYLKEPVFQVDTMIWWQ
ncbi:MAG: hypothetical protein HeimC3_13540 [Candidatus Heimdallarchaeota archaeon LC_3]|nr:MAG: hypothetical protein HeimC3_13540 [Candidatus Heimdallarchaeota archaeon LC_3]